MIHSHRKKLIVQAIVMQKETQIIPPIGSTEVSLMPRSV